MSCEYIIEKHTHGWLICAPPGQKGVPMAALGECQPLYGPGATIDAGIAHHFNALDHGKHVCFAVTTENSFAVTTENSSVAWRAEIAEKIKNYNPQQRWWCGTDVGTSSAAMFAVLCSPMSYLRGIAMGKGQRSTPRDSADLGRCLRLLEAMPEWRGRLNEVAEAYPETAWPEIIAAWEELENADPRYQNDILNECHKTHKRRTS